MDRASLSDVRRRAMTLWSLVSAAAAGLLAVVGPTADDLLRAPGADFADLLVQVCAATALLAGSVLWLATTDVALSVLRSRLPARRLGPLRSALLAACGVAVLTTTAPASASAPEGPEQPTSAEILEGLPLPDRAESPPPALARAGERADRDRDRDRAAATVRVRPGDSLWSIAARIAGPTATDAAVAAYWQRLRTLNASTTGDSPDLIHPGQQLDLPPR